LCILHLDVQIISFPIKKEYSLTGKTISFKLIVLSSNLSALEL
jgi:hypothetical protein